jgi:DtxR family transcriptional regulator, manganese transport regulator
MSPKVRIAKTSGTAGGCSDPPVRFTLAFWRSQLLQSLLAMTQNRFQRTREDHSRELNEDYVELIDDLIVETGEARITDLATRLGVSKVTVSKRVGKLTEAGLVHSSRYRDVTLTHDGKKLADEARERHRLVYEFLISLGISPETAETDAEGIEHHCSEETLRAMTAAASKLS